MRPIRFLGFDTPSSGKFDVVTHGKISVAQSSVGLWRWLLLCPRHPRQGPRPHVKCLGKCKSLEISIFLYFFLHFRYVYHTHWVLHNKSSPSLHPVTVAPLVYLVTPTLKFELLYKNPWLFFLNQKRYKCRAFISHMYIPCDKIFHVLLWYVTLTFCLTCLRKTLTFAITFEPERVEHSYFT